MGGGGDAVAFWDKYSGGGGKDANGFENIIFSGKDPMLWQVYFSLPGGGGG